MKLRNAKKGEDQRYSLEQTNYQVSVWFRTSNQLKDEPIIHLYYRILIHPEDPMRMPLFSPLTSRNFVSTFQSE